MKSMPTLHLLIVSDVGDGEGACPQLDQNDLDEQEEEETGPQASLSNSCHKRKTQEWDKQVGKCVLQVQCDSFKAVFVELLLTQDTLRWFPYLPYHSIRRQKYGMLCFEFRLHSCSMPLTVCSKLRCAMQHTRLQHIRQLLQVLCCCRALAESGQNPAALTSSMASPPVELTHRL